MEFTMRHLISSHSSDINDLLEGLDGVLEDWLNRLHDTESSLHIVDLWLDAFDGLHLSGDLNEWLSIIESLEDSGSEGFLDVLDGGGLGNGGSPSPLASESRALERVELKLTRSSSSFMESYLVAATAATRRQNFILECILIIKNSH